jgi:hypothetical protein
MLQLPCVAEPQLGRAKIGGSIELIDRLLHGLIGLFEHGSRDIARGDFAQCDYGGLVVLPFDRGLGAIGESPSPLGREQYEIEQVRFVLQTVFDGNSSHKGLPIRVNQRNRIRAGAPKTRPAGPAAALAQQRGRELGEAAAIHRQCLALAVNDRFQVLERTLE